jgi:protoheme IX farnesyltransferase
MMDDYRKSGLPMLPVTHGNEFTRLQIFLYAGAVRRLRHALHLSHERLAVPGGRDRFDFGFSWYGWRLWRNSSDALAPQGLPVFTDSPVGAVCGWWTTTLFDGWSRAT